MWYLLSACSTCTGVCAVFRHIWMFCTLVRVQSCPDWTPGAWAHGLKWHWSKSWCRHCPSSCPAALSPPALPLWTHTDISVPIKQSRSKGCCSQQCSQTECVEGKALLCSCAHCHFSQVMAAAKSAPNRFSKQCLTAYMLRSKPRLAAFNTFPSLFLCIKINFMNFPR